MKEWQQPKTILIPLDFSEASSAALDYAVPFAETLRAKMVLLYVVATPLVPLELYGLTPDYETLVNTATKNLQNIAKQHCNDAEQVIVDVRKGTVDEQILEAAEQHGCDMIVMSTHGHRGIEHFLIGSTTERVVRSARVPVLTVKPGL